MQKQKIKAEGRKNSNLNAETTVEPCFISKIKPDEIRRCIPPPPYPHILHAATLGSFPLSGT
jgi:hypothetical protein